MARAATDTTLIAHELRIVLATLMRRLRYEGRLPFTQGAVLGRLDRCESSRSIGELATAEGVRPQSMAQTVGDLEEAGYVSRAPDPGDGRRVLIALTDAGREALAAERESREGWLNDLISRRLEPDEQATLAAAVVLLRRLAEDG